MPTRPIPAGYSSAVPYLCCKGAGDAMALYQKAFGAQVVMKLETPGGGIAHAEMKIGEALFMLADEYPAMGFVSPATLGGTPVLIHIYTSDVDALAAKATAAGCTVLRPVEDQFYGDRTVTLTDPFGHRWGFATRIEDLTPEEISRRAAAKFG